MKKGLKVFAWLLAALVLLLSWPAWQLYDEIRRARSEDPLVWEDAIAALEARSRGVCAPGECVVFVGSSSIRLWNTLEEDMSPIPVLSQGFGGAKLNDVVHYARRLVTAYSPRAVVVFAGTNDITPSSSKQPGVLLASYQSLVETLRATQPGLPLYYIGITPSPRRWSVWSRARETNALIAAWSATQPGLGFIDTSDALMGEDGEPLRENYRFDGLHLSERGYGVWADIIRSRLLQDLGIDGREVDPQPAGEVAFTVTAVTDRLAMPWSFAFLPGGDILVTERGGTLRRLHPDSGTLASISGVPAVFHEGQGGLFDVALHPDFPARPWIYLTYAAPMGEGRSTTRLVRARLEGDALGQLQVLYTAAPAEASQKHYGGRLLFADGYLYMTVGERGHRKRAQALDNDLGKVLRFYPDGRIPADNPFIATAGAKPAIYSYGHRNPQGLARHPETGAIWVTEHGPQGGDELNRLHPGANYGWPVITYGEEYGGGVIGEGVAKAGMEQPVYYYVPSIATGGLAFYHGEQFPAWRGDAFIGALRQLHLNRVAFAPDGSIAEHRLLEDLGLRVRDVKVGPDGNLYILSEQGSLLRLAPAGADP